MILLIIIYLLLVTGKRRQNAHLQFSMNLFFSYSLLGSLTSQWTPVSICWLVGWFVDWLAFRFVIISFKKQEVTLPCSYQSTCVDHLLQGHFHPVNFPTWASASGWRASRPGSPGWGARWRGGRPSRCNMGRNRGWPHRKLFVWIDR